MSFKHRRPPRDTPMYYRFLEETMVQQRTDIQRLWKRTPQIPDPEIGIPYFFALPPGASSISSGSSSSSSRSSSSSSRSSVSSRSSGSSASSSSGSSSISSRSSSSSSSQSSGPIACSYCTSAPVIFNYTFAGITNGGGCLDCNNLNGTFSVNHNTGTADCIWEGSLPNTCGASMPSQLQYNHTTNTTTLSISGIPFNAGATYTASGCPSVGTVLSLQSSTGCTNWPATVTLA